MIAIPVLAVVCLLTFLHYVGAQMRAPVLPLYAAAHGATATGVGFIIGAHMAVAAVGSIPLGRASDAWGRRPLLLGGIVVSVVTSLLLPLVESELALITIYGLAGVGVAAFTPSALSLVGDAAGPGRAGHAYAWYSTAHYGAIGIGPLLGGLAAGWWGYRTAFVASALVIVIALVVGLAIPVRPVAQRSPRSDATFADVRRNASVWAGWIVSVSGLFIQGVVFYLGLALGSFTLGPVITRYGYVPGFAIGGATGVLGALVAALLWAAGRVAAPVDSGAR